MKFPNEPLDAQECFGVDEIGPNAFRSKNTMPKPSPASTGAYGGALAGQAVLVAMKTAPGYLPNSLHSNFLRPTSGNKLVDWTVENISQGRNFCSRQVRALQEGKVTYMANISLTKKNSHEEATKEYEDYKKSAGNKVNNKDKDNDDDDDDDDDEVSEVIKPFEFQTPYPEWLNQHSPETLEVDRRQNQILVYHKVPPQMFDLSLTPEEDKLQMGERRVAWYAQWGANEEDLKQKVFNVEPEMRYPGLAYISDSLFLLILARTFRLKSVDLTHLVHYWSVSLDHTIFFHDDDFDSTKWMGFAMRTMRLINGRVLLELEIYNDKKVHVASVVQEGLIRVDHLKEDLKL